MLSVVIPTANAGGHLARCLSALVPAAVDGFVRQVIVSDGGSTDVTCEMADAAGADVVSGKPGRGRQLAAGADRATSAWLLFINPETRLAEGWERDASRFMQLAENGDMGGGAAAFRLRIDSQGIKPRIIELLTAVRCRVLRLPYGDQGLLISRRLYNEIGGFRDVPFLEDVDLVRRLGRHRVALLNAVAETPANHLSGKGYLRQALRQQLRLALYRAGLPIERIARLHA